MNHLPFLRAIAQAPHDDLPRLVYADALEESGEPELVARAHFIRGQIEFASTVDWMEKRVLGQAIGKLFASFHKRWFADAPPPFGFINESHFERGFPVTLNLTESDIVNDGQTIFETTPIQKLTLSCSTSDASFKAFDQYPFFHRIHYLQLDLYTALETRDFVTKRNFLERVLCPHVWLGVEHLSLADNSLNDSFLTLLLNAIESGFVPKIHTLDLGRCVTMIYESAAAIVSAKDLNGLQKLLLKHVDCPQNARRLLKRHFGSRVEF